MDFNLSEEQLQHQNQYHHFAQEEIAPHLERIEQDLEYRKTIFQKMAEQGLFSLCLPKEWGGSFTDTIKYVLAMMAIAQVDAGITVAMSVTNMVGEAIYRYGNEAQKKRYLPQIALGKCVPAAFALTEKSAGSDAKSIQMRAIKNRDGSYVLSGEKQFISNGDLAKVLIVFAKTDLEDPAHGMTAFLLDQGTSGFSVVKKENKLGLLSANLVNLKFDHCHLLADQILGPMDEGFKIAMSSLDSGRISIAAQAIGIAEAAYQAAIAYAGTRQQFGKPIGQFEAIGFKLADMHVQLNAAKLLLFKACDLKDRGLPFTLAAAEAKLFCSEVCNDVVNEALQIHGGYGYIKDYPLEKYFRDARVTTLYEGTSEIQRLVIAKHILKSLFKI